MTAHQRQQKRIQFFSAAHRQLMATDEYADDWYGSRDVAMGIADQQMALLEKGHGGGSAELGIQRPTAMSVAPVSMSTQIASQPTPAFSWDEIVAETNARLSGASAARDPASDDFWDDAFGKTPPTAPSQTSERKGTSGTFSWDEVMTEHLADQRRYHRQEPTR